VDTREALLECIHDAARHMNNPRVLRILSRSVVQQATLRVVAEDDHFEHLL
jgi:hypothetical protein